MNTITAEAQAYRDTYGEPLSYHIDAVDALVVKHVCGFDTLGGLIAGKGNYRPTIRCTRAANRSATVAELAELKQLADAYDAAQANRGDPRRAFRG